MNNGAMDLFRQWQDATAGALSGMSGTGRNYLDPFGIYRGWMDSLAGNPGGEMDSQDLWREWMEATGEVWRRATELSEVSAGLAPHWAEATEAFWKEMLEGGKPPTDPLDFYSRWYKATSGPFSKMAREVAESEPVLEESRRFTESYALLEGAFQRASEKYFGDLRISTRSDTARVAALVVGLEDKVDDIEVVVEDHADETADSLANIESRISDIERKLDERSSTLERIEDKLDRLLDSDDAESDPDTEPEATEPEATDAARRKARDMGIGLEDIEGSGAGGRITVEDVRKKGEA